MSDIILYEKIRNKIIILRGEQCILDKDIAELYGVKTKVLIQAIKRNTERFPGDFMFQLSNEEYESLRSQIVTSSWGGRRYAPYAFTERGVAMLSSVLRSKKAIEINIAIMRVFVMIARIINSNTDLAEKINKLQDKYGKHDKKIKDIIFELKFLIKNKEEDKNSRELIGFKAR